MNAKQRQAAKSILQVLESEDFEIFYTDQLDSYVEGCGFTSEEDVLKEITTLFHITP